MAISFAERIYSGMGQKPDDSFLLRLIHLTKISVSAEMYQRKLSKEETKDNVGEEKKSKVFENGLTTLSLIMLWTEKSSDFQ